MSSHGDVPVEVNSQIADATDRLDYVGADNKRYIWELTLTTGGRSPKNFSFGGIQLQTVRPHPCGYVVDADISSWRATARSGEQEPYI